jgi:hypothetical protein
VELPDPLSWAFYLALSMFRMLAILAGGGVGRGVGGWEGEVGGTEGSSGGQWWKWDGRRDEVEGWEGWWERRRGGGRRWRQGGADADTERPSSCCS